MTTRANQILGQTAISLQIASARQVEQGQRIVEAQELRGEVTSLDRVLQERGSSPRPRCGGSRPTLGFASRPALAVG